MGLIIGSGLALAYQSAHYALWFVLIAWCALILANHHCTSLWGRLKLWFTAGVSFYGTSLWWVRGYLRSEYTEAIWIQYGLWPFLISILAVSFLLPPLITHLLSAKRTLFVLPFVLALLDMAREHTDFSFAWLNPGLLLLDVGFSGWLSTIGTFGGAFLVYSIASLSAFAIMRLQQSDIILLLIPPVVSFTLWVGNSLLTASGTESETISVRLIHGDFSDEEKRSKGRVIARVEQFTALSLGTDAPSFVIWPESTLSVAYQDVDKWIAPSFETLSSSGTTALYGGLYRNGQHLHNVIFQSRDAKPIYYKRYPVPFGEARPPWFRQLFQSVPLSRGQDVVSGFHSSAFLSIGDSAIALAICYDAFQSDVFLRSLRDKPSGVLVLLGDVAWTHALWVKRLLLRLAQVRAAEVGKPLLYSTNQGFTAFIDSQGRVVENKTPKAHTAALDVDVPISLSQTRYTTWGSEWLGWLFLGVIMMTLLVPRQCFAQTRFIFKSE
ncbi:apolipoprotein N-acyltransferase [Vibrio mediterranei]|uniref:apolipoprotein N-acyltransferase n=1 Tax=Vibrio mediterranei TaxID=689 RepID=UPI00228445DF|nr:apolipoprotein N-acyltransferase [Vibrio mediterranei]MCY9852192.1 apolipoprotein N-acyltransferase [Vibrio mediterranei]